MKKFYIIDGQKFEDHRGKIMANNTFDMRCVVRHYVLFQTDNTVIRAWQGHKIETKWMKCLYGSFTISLIACHDVASPTGKETIDVVKLNGESGSLLCVPGGYYTGIKGDQAHSSLIVFSDFTLEQSLEDDFRKPLDFWNFKCN